MISRVLSILTSDRTTVAGHGILIGNDRLLTTAETIALALTIPSTMTQKPEDDVFIELPFNNQPSSLQAKVVHWLPTSPNASDNASIIENIAILQLSQPIPELNSSSNVTRTVPTDRDYRSMIDAITEGTLVPFFGAGVNLCGRPQDARWRRGEFLPSGQELATDLANTFSYPWSDTRDLVRVSQYVALIRGLGPLNRRLRHIFDIDYPPTPLHRFFATLPGMLRQKGYPPYQLIVTTNYDDVLERAFKEANEPYDLIIYVTRGSSEQRGKFLHWSPEGDVKLIDIANQYHLPLDRNRNLTRTAILKLHGAVDRLSEPGTQRDSFVITEDHYIDYLTRSDISNLVPVTLSEKLRSSSFLFLGYSLRDWNLRVILYRIWLEQQQKEDYRSWAIQMDPEELETRFWDERDVTIFNARLEDYIAEMTRRVETLPPAPIEE